MSRSSRQNVYGVSLKLTFDVADHPNRLKTLLLQYLVILIKAGGIKLIHGDSEVASNKRKKSIYNGDGAVGSSSLQI